MHAPVRRPNLLPAAGTALLCATLAGCAGGTAAPPPPPREASNSPHYVCANGTSFVTQADPATGGMVLWIGRGAAHRLAPVPDLNGGTLYQDSAFQLRPAPFGATATLTDRANVSAQACSRL